MQDGWETNQGEGASSQQETQERGGDFGDVGSRRGQKPEGATSEGSWEKQEAEGWARVSWGSPQVCLGKRQVGIWKEGTPKAEGKLEACPTRLPVPGPHTVQTTQCPHMLAVGVLPSGAGWGTGSDGGGSAPLGSCCC